MEKQWFVLHTLSGFEYKVKESIEFRAKQAELQDYIGEVLIPTEKVSEVKQGKRSTHTRKFFPGYVLVDIALYQPDKTVDARVWTFFTDRTTQGIIGFIGGDRPVPLRPQEVESVMRQVEDKREKVKPKVEFEAGETVKITEGPFQNFTGVIEEVDAVRGKLKVSVSIFGRTAPVDLEYWQVERA